VFKIISRNLIQKRTGDVNIQKKKQNDLTTACRFKTNTIGKILWPLSKKESTRDTIHRHTQQAQGLQSIIGRFQTRSTFCKFSEVVESFTAKEEDGLTFNFILDVLEAKIFRYNFMEGHNV